MNISISTNPCSSHAGGGATLQACQNPVERSGNLEVTKLAWGLAILTILGHLSLSCAQLPLSSGAPYVGKKVAGFTLPDQHGRQVSLADLLDPAPGKKSGGLVLIFYRGYW